MPRKEQLRNLRSREELTTRLDAEGRPRTTLSFYRYHQIADPQEFRDECFRAWSTLGVLGRVYIAHEGLNGQVSVPTDRLDEFRAALYAVPFMDGMRLNIAREDDGKSFLKLIVRLKAKIVADGLDDDTFDVTRRGEHLDARRTNELLARPETLVVDMRNHYESEVGYFKNAIRPPVDTFRDALPVVEEMLKDDRDRPIVMYCTGGIRCEKASAYYLHRGFSQVKMIDGGIIEYARQCAEQGLENHYVGKNFVFDERMGERISEDVVASCHQCGTTCDTHVNCANDACHLLLVQCPACAARYRNCCSDECAEFNNLPEEERREQRPNRRFAGSFGAKGKPRV